MTSAEDIIRLRTPKPRYPLISAIAHRFSPRVFALEEIPEVHLNIMFEAARWAPSARNYQPWYFYWMRRGSKAHEKLVSCVAERHHWVKSAPVIILACYDPLDPKDGTKNRWAIYDLGAAVISLVLQAHELGYFCRQIGSFDAEKAKTNLGLDPRWTPFVSVAVGKIGSYVGVDPTYGEMDKQATPRKTDLAQKLE